MDVLTEFEEVLHGTKVRISKEAMSVTVPSRLNECLNLICTQIDSSIYFQQLYLCCVELTR